eukprot:jgi/Mesvir1/8019/Mv04430-RA.1
MSTKLIPVDLEEEEAGSGGGVSAPAVRGGVMDNVEPDIPIPVNMDRVVREVVPPAPPPPAAVQVIDDEAGDSGVEDGSVRGWDSDVRKVQVDAVKKKAKRRSGGKKSQTAASATDDPSRVTMDL